MDTTTKLISFDEKGVCNFCKNYDSYYTKYLDKTPEQLKIELDGIIKKLKSDGKGKKYDCIVGLSGGVDSSYIALLCKDYGLRPLIFHFDNGWNSELAVQNITNICEKLNFDLNTYVIDWEAFKDIQLSYIKAGVIDWEVPTDQMIFASLYETAEKNGIKNVISGSNVRTEFTLPSDWIFPDKLDYINLQNIQNKFGTVDIKKLPRIPVKGKDFFYGNLDYKPVHLLSYIIFNKKEALRRLIEEVGYRPYPNKHGESVYTRFYQGYVLPTRLGIDKRKAHLSSLVQSGMLTRDEALSEFAKPIYDPILLNEDFDYVLKKFDLTEGAIRRIHGIAFSTARILWY
ncbi:MAG: N-acetyl sugar amidotransferase [Sphingobacteriaceae bacterium]|nr:N-acetyl sugar amidotransferase [Sphingobacteriaceae bacterium]